MPGGHRGRPSLYHWSRTVSPRPLVSSMPPAYAKPYERKWQRNDGHRCGGYFPSGNQGEYAVCRDQDARAAEWLTLALQAANCVDPPAGTAVINVTPGDLAEFGIVVPVGRKDVQVLLNVLTGSSEQTAAGAAYSITGCRCRSVLRGELMNCAKPRYEKTRARQHDAENCSPLVDDALGYFPVDHRLVALVVSVITRSTREAIRAVFCCSP